MIKYLSKDTVIYAIKRAIWTMAEVMLSFLAIGMTLTEIDWPHVLSVTAVAGIVSLLKSIVIGMPETDTDGELIIEETDEKQSWTLNVESDPYDVAGKTSIRLKVENKL